MMSKKEKVKSVDDSLLYHEFLCYHGDKLFDFTPEIHIDVKDNSKKYIRDRKGVSLYVRGFKDKIILNG